jgi:uncharacterized Tic20 family protein
MDFSMPEDIFKLTKEELEKVEKENTFNQTQERNSFFLGVLSILLSFIPFFGLILGLLAVYYSNKQIKFMQTRKLKAAKLFGITGIVLSLTSLIVFLGYLFVFLV